MPPTIENHVIVIWPWARRQKKIARYVRRNFFVLDEFTGHTTLREFYGLGPGGTAGSVTAKAFVVRTMYARQPRPTSTGKRPVNPFMFDAKQKLRKWGGKEGSLNSVHASDSQQEAVQNIYNLLPGGVVPFRNGAVVLREGDDIDLLVEDVGEYVNIFGAIRIDGYNVIAVEEEDVKYKYLIRTGNKLQVLDIREPGDGYMDERWQQAILDSGEYDEYAQLYHALIHKGEDGDMEKLLTYMDEHGYGFTRPTDPYFVQFNSLTGQVVDGHGAASTEPQPGLRDKWIEGCGFEPYPGTLNIKYEGRFQLPTPHHSSSILALMTGTNKVEPQPLHFWNARINGHPCVLSVGGNRPDEVEVLASTHLRTTLGLGTGDEVTVVVAQ